MASWWMALALAGLLLPSHPAAAFALAAGQGLAAFNFFFLERLVKLFTEAASSGLAEGAGGRGSRDAAFLGWAALKLLVVYGGAFALLRFGRVELAPFAAGLSMPLLALFLKSIMLISGYGPSAWVRRANQTAAPFGDAAKPAALRFVLAPLVLLALAAGPATAQADAPDPGAAAIAAAEHPDAGSAEHGGTAPADHGGEDEQHLPNWVVLLNDYFPENRAVHWMHENEILVFAWLAGIVFFGLAWIAMRKPKHVPGQLQNAVEWVVESMEDVCGGLLGKHLGRYFPYVIAVFFYVLTMNLIGIIPGFKSSTSSLDVTLALALLTFVYVQYSGIRNLGLLGYIDHLAGSPRDAVGFAMLPVMLPIHLLGELAKPVSLSCRLFGNIFGEDTLIVVFVGIGALCLKASLLALAVPPLMGITALFMMLQTLTSIVQALIFSLLTTVYLYMMLPHEAADHGEAAPAH